MAKYFVPKRNGGKKRAHIWLGKETACRLSSTGGLNPRRYMVADSPGNREICTMCETNAAKRKPQLQASNAKRVVWGDTWEDFFEPANKHLGL